MSYLDVVRGISDGAVLMCEDRRDNVLVDRWLVQRDFVDEFRFLEPGHEVRIRRLEPARAQRSIHE